ncbi:hypothetical protein ACFJYA_08015 [Enterococcus faecalis]
MAEKKKSLLQVLKDAINSYQEQEVTEEEQEVLEDVEQNVEELEELEEVEGNVDSQDKEKNDSEIPKEVGSEEEPEGKDQETSSYSADEVKAKLEGLALSEESLKEATEFLVTLTKETTDKLVPLLRKVLEETTVTSIKTLLQDNKAKKPKDGAKKAPNSLGKEMAQQANQRKGK